MSDSMIMLMLHDLITLGEVQHPNGPTFHDRDDPTSNLLNVVLPGFNDLPFTLVVPMISVMGYSVTVLVLMFITVTMVGS